MPSPRKIYQAIGATPQSARDAIEAFGPTSSASGPVIDANTVASSLVGNPFSIFEPTADRTIDIPGTGSSAWDTTKSAILKIYKDTRSLFGLTVDVFTNGGGLWTTPAGLGQNFLLPGSSDQLPGAWDLVIDGPSKTVRVITYPRGIMEPMVPAPSVGPGDTIDLFTAGVYGGPSGIGSRQIGAPTSDGSAFLAVRANGTTRDLENLGDGLGDRLLYEPQRSNLCLQSETLYSAGGAIQAPWVAVGGTTGVGAVAGSPKGDAKVSRLTFTASAADGIQQTIAGTALTPAVFSFYARVSAGTKTIRLTTLLMDGVTLLTTGDVLLTTTWQRLVLRIPVCGLFGAAGNIIVSVLNGTNGLAGTVDLYGGQCEIAGIPSGLNPTGYIPTTVGTATRLADTLQFVSADIPASFRTRGIKIDYRPYFSPADMWNAGQLSSYPLFTFDATAAFPTAGVVEGVWLNFVTNTMPAGKSGRIRIGGFDAGIQNGSYNPSAPRYFTDPVQWTAVAALPLLITAEAYRGCVRVQQALSGNGYHFLNSGTWTWASAGIGGGGALGGSKSNGGFNQIGGGTYGRFITAA